MKDYGLKVVKNQFGIQLITYPINNTSEKKQGEPCVDRDYLQEARNRAKRQVIEYGLNNVWSYFITFTFDEKKIDRYNYDYCLKQITQFFNDYKKRKDADFKYILIPELHTKKDGEERAAIHFHGLIYCGNEFDIKRIGYDKTTKKNIYQLVSYFKRFGACRLYKINENTQAITYYILKYINKGEKIFKRCYFNSKNLNTSEILISSKTDKTAYQKFLDFTKDYSIRAEYQSEYCQIFQIPNEFFNLMFQNDISI